MRRTLAHRAGDAIVWQGIQFGGVKLVYLVRVVILARLLSPSDFGLFAVALIALEFVLSVTNFGMVQALVQRPDATRTHYESAWTIGLVRAFAVGAGLALLAPWIAELFGESDGVELLRLLALRPIIQATGSIGVAKLEKNLRFRSLAVLRLSEAVVNAVLSIALVAPIGVWALVVGPLAGAVAYASLSYVVAPMAPRLRFGGAVTGHLVRYGRWILLTAWFAVAGRSVLQLSISRHLGVAALGLYFMATKVAWIPADVASQVAGSVAFPVFAMIQDDVDRLRRVFRAALLGLSALVVPSALLIVALAPSLATDLLGDRWTSAVPLIQILAATTILGLLGDVIVPLLQGVGRPDRSARMEAIQAVLVAGLAWILAPRWGVTGVVLAWIPAVLASGVLGVFYLRREVPRSLEGLTGPLLAILGVSVAGAGVGLAANQVLTGAIGVIAAGLLGALVAYAALLAVEVLVGLGLTQHTVRMFPGSRRILIRFGLGHRLPGEPVENSQ